MDKEIKHDFFKFAPDILKRLGEELNPSADQGIVELIRNAYDADAVRCRVELLDVKTVGGTVRITDDGVGMTEDDIRNGWLVLGRSRKAGQAETEKLHRLIVGDKGLGRLAALRLGTRAVVETRPEKQAGTAHRVCIDWAAFDVAKTVESIPLLIETTTTALPPGTTIEISSLRASISKEDAQRLSRALLLLTDPFDKVSGFNVELAMLDFPEIEQDFERSFFDEAEYHVRAELGIDGFAGAVILNRVGEELFRADPMINLRSPYHAPAATFELWEFNQGSSFARRNRTIAETREWLSKFGGVYLYHRGLRVHPYGDPGYDWLQMNLSRARSPEKRPSTNNSTGYVSVLDASERLIPKTDRSGFIENEAFGELGRFAKDVLNWMAATRVRERDVNRQKERAAAPKRVAEAKETVAQAVNDLPTAARPSIEDAIASLEEAREFEVKSLQEEVQLYRALATVGTTASVFAHQSPAPLIRLKKAATTIRGLTGPQVVLLPEDTLNAVADLIDRAAKALSGFGGLLLKLLVREKRHNSIVAVDNVICDVVDQFRPFVEASGITLTYDAMDGVTPLIPASEAAIEAIVSNLITNALHILIYADPKPQKPLIILQWRVCGTTLYIRCVDNGPGIKGISVDDIWLPGRTTRQHGTGLGLTIVKDSVIDLGGSVQAISAGSLGGAEFVIELPLKEQP